MENSVYITGEYVSGVVKRPDLVGQPCVLAYGDGGFVLSVLAGDTAEAFGFSYDTIDSVTSNNRLLVSENMGTGGEDPKTYEKLLAFAINGFKGYSVAKIAELSNQAFRNTIGKMDYSHMFELIVNYHTQEGPRRIFIRTHGNPSGFISYFDTIKQ